MKRWLRRILIRVVLGVVTTVGVAWGCPLLIQDDFGSTTRSGYVRHKSTLWEVGRSRMFGHMLINGTANPLHPDWQLPEESQFGIAPRLIPMSEIPRWSCIRDEADFDPRSDLLRYSTEHASGFPFYALRARVFEVSIMWRHDAPSNPGHTIHGDTLTVTEEDGFVWFELQLAPGDGVEGGVLLWVETLSDRHVESFVVLPLTPILPGFLINTLFYAALWFVLFFAAGAVKRWRRRRLGRCIDCGYDLRGHGRAVSHQPSAVSRTESGEPIADSPVRCPECGGDATGGHPRA